MTLFLNILIGVLGGQNFFLSLKICIFCYSFFTVIIFLDRAELTYSGTENNKFQDKDRYSFCNKWKIYYNLHKKVDHCTYCNVCITQLDHHYVWVGKCVGKYNLWAFYEIIIAIGIFYIYAIICVVTYNVK